MARTGISYEDVRAAAETLLGRGLNPTIQRVRELLGTGSNTTISEHLKSWQQQLAQAPKTVLPPTVPETVITALDAFWNIAVQHAEAAFEEQRQIAAQAVTAAEQSRDSALADLQKAQAAANDFRLQLEASQASARALADRLLVEQERRAAAETAIESAEQRARAAAETVAQIRAETEARIAQLETLLQQTREDLQRQQAETRQRLEIERQRAEANEVRLTAILDQSRAEWVAERHAFASERNDWKNREITWLERLEQLDRENVSAREALAVANERQRALTVGLQQTRVDLQESEARHIEALRASENLRGELTAALENRQRLNQQPDRDQRSRSGRKAAPKSKE